MSQAQSENGVANRSAELVSEYKAANDIVESFERQYNLTMEFLIDSKDRTTIYAKSDESILTSLGVEENNVVEINLQKKNELEVIFERYSREVRIIVRQVVRDE